MFSKKKALYWGIVILLLVFFTFLGYSYIYQDHRNIETEEAAYNVTPKTIINEFNLDANKSEKKYLNKTIVVTGIITEINENDLTLNDIVFCQLNGINNKSIKMNSTIKIKGRCIGYDDLLEQVKLDQCSTIE